MRVTVGVTEQGASTGSGLRAGRGHQCCDRVLPLGPLKVADRDADGLQGRIERRSEAWIVADFEPLPLFLERKWLKGSDQGESTHSKRT
ncbi:MAG: hypothetical protein E6I18_16815 [Chloroflexi bacterium]|nr:MAG: hypothetical protein E6I18_16815 [Chloroflexota bacterium]